MATVRAIADKVRAGGATQGDPTLLPEAFTEVERREVDRTFGNGFAGMLDTLTPGKWSDPIRSGLGFHLVRLTSRAPARLPDLEEIRLVVKREWANQKRLELRRQFNEELLKDHEVVIEWPRPAGKAGSET
jgi:hypothetical protein